MTLDSLESIFEYAKRDRYSITDVEWKEKDHPRGNPENAGQFVKKDQRGVVIEKASSVQNISDKEFEKPTRSYQLPPLNKKFSDAIGKPAKDVLLSKHTIERMMKDHPEMKDGKNRKRILNNALNNFTELLYSRPRKKPNYYAVVKTGGHYDLSVIDTDKNKEFYEVVDWREIDEDGYQKMIEQMNREGGQFLITDGRTSTGRLTFPLFRFIMS
ncbi:MAG: hypothetical protein II814_01250 [Treponema sp.]|nr:hypothetical protein [Treponema sp.]